MGRFFSGKKNNSGEPEDFVLMQHENSEGENGTDNQGESETERINKTEPSEQYADFESYNDDASEDDFEDEASKDEVLTETATLNVSEVSEALNNSLDAEKKGKASSAGLAEFVKKHRVPTICVCGVLIVAIISLASFGIIKSANPLRNYTQIAVAKDNIMSTMEQDGVLSSGDKYEIMSLVAGKVAECKYEVGDSVNEGDVLYQLDDTEAKLALERAKNELERAKDTNASSSGSISGAGRITATDTGTIQTINIKQGSTVTAGMQVGTIKKSDGAVVPIVSYVSGSVMMVNVAVGREVSMGQILASVKPTSSSTSTGNSEYDKKTGEIDVQSAQKQLDNYSIKSPVSGVIIEKNSKTGDNVGAGNSYKAMMVVMDTSKLTLTVSVGEDRIAEVEKGQSVTLTTDSVPDTTFSGEVSNVSLEGKQVDGGKTAFDVTIVISEPGKLKAGMSVKAKIVLDSVKNTAAVDKKALLKTDGQNALVLVKLDNTGEDRDVSETIENQNNNPDIKVPKGCELRTVKYGVSDENKVQILSGLKLGEIACYDPDADNGEFIPSTNSDNDDDSDSAEVDGDLSSDNENIGDEEAKDEVKKRMQEMLGTDSI